LAMPIRGTFCCIYRLIYLFNLLISWLTSSKSFMIRSKNPGTKGLMCPGKDGSLTRSWNPVSREILNIVMHKKKKRSSFFTALRTPVVISYLCSLPTTSFSSRTNLHQCLNLAKIEFSETTFTRSAIGNHQQGCTGYSRLGKPYHWDR